jgi:hypothetical protein
LGILIEDLQSIATILAAGYLRHEVNALRKEKTYGDRDADKERRLTS